MTEPLAPTSPPGREREAQRNLRVLVTSVVAVTAACALALSVVKPREVKEPRQHFTPAGHALLGKAGQGAEIVLFIDYNCPACKAFERDHLPAIREKIIQPGYAHLYLYQSPFLAPSSQDMAVAAQCALQQGQNAFWRYHELLLRRAAGEHDPAPHQELRTLAKSAGLDLGRWEGCLKSPQARQQVQNDLQTHQRVNMLGTPAVFVNGERTPAGSRNIAVAINEQQARTPEEKTP